MSHGSDDTGAAPQGAVGWIAALIGWSFGAAAALLVLVILGLTALNVTGRYLFTAPIRGAEEATGFLVVALVMLGAAEAYRRGDHIRIDLLTSRLGSRGTLAVNLLAHVAVLVFALVLLRTGIHTVEFSRMFGAYSAGYLQIPMWIPQSTLIAGGALLSAMGALRLIGDLAALRGRRRGA